MLPVPGLGSVGYGGRRLAFDVRGAAHASAERARLATELNTARLFAAGLVLILAGLLEL